MGNIEQDLSPKGESRRRFILGLAAGTIAVALKAGSTNSAQASESPLISQGASPLATPDAAPSQELVQTSGWGDLPIVDGEPILDGEVLTTPLLRITGQINYREQPAATGNKEPAIPGSVLEIQKGLENVPDEKGDSYTWTGGELVFDGENVMLKSDVKYVASSIEGATQIITLPNEMTEKESELLGSYVKKMEIPNSSSEFDTAGISIFENIGGTEDPIPAMWGEKTLSSGLTDSWKRAVSVVAIETSTSGSVQDTVMNVCQTFGDAGTCNFYGVSNPDGSIDVISRMLNPNDVTHKDIFTVTRFKKDAKGKLIVNATGFTTPEGLQTAYPDKASKIAESITALTGEANVQVAGEINQLPQAKVFLPGENAYGPKLEVDSKKVIRIGNKIVKTKEFYQYEKVNGKYRARLYGEVDGNNGLIIATESVSVPVGDENIWAELPNVANFSLAAEPYISAYGLSETPEEIYARIDIRSVQTEKGTLVEIYDPITSIPLFDAMVKNDEEILFRKGMRDLVEASGKNFGFFIDPSKPKERQMVEALYSEANSLTIGAFSVNWLSTGPESLVDPTRTYLANGFIADAEARGVKIDEGNALVYEAEFPQWIIDSRMSVKELQDLLIQRAVETVEAFPQIDTWYVGNEFIKVFQGVEMFDNDVTQQITGGEVVNIDFIKRLCGAVRNKAIEMGAPEKKIGINDYVNLVSQKDGRFVIDNSLSGQKADFLERVVRELVNDGLVDVLGLQMHLHNASDEMPTQDQITAFLNRFAAITEVSVTEMTLHQNISYEAVLKGILLSNAKGVTIWGVNQEEDWSQTEGVTYLFANQAPTAAYYAVKKAFSDTVFAQS